jgi:hypothetical protein
MRLQFNEVLQWAGTAFILSMYVVSNFFKGEDDLRNFLALLGGLCYATWAYRVANKPQMIVNVVAITLCVLGLFKVLG